MHALPFNIDREFIGDSNTAIRLLFIRDGSEVCNFRHSIGSIGSRKEIARQVCKNRALQNGQPLALDEVVAEIVLVETQHRFSMIAGATSEPAIIETAMHVDKSFIAELAWSCETNSADFVVYERATHSVKRAGYVDVGGIRLVPPECSKGICTPGDLPGNVFLPSKHDETGIDETQLRADVLGFINRYVELPGEAANLAVEYVLLSWVYDGFSELPYMAFRTADAGRGKSRALNTVGQLCYRPFFAGGGSTPAATLRLLDTFRGTLCADEFDQRRDSDMASEITKIINQGFEKNRPLIRCSGENNDPRPFHVFGPKLFCLRGKFSDDASETRILSIRMKQRTRDDIPLTLPAEFSGEALRLRNRLLAWRFANVRAFKVNLGDADTGLEDRSNQIGLPLMAIAGPTERQRIVDALREQESSVAGDRADSLSGGVFETMLGLYLPGDMARPVDVTKVMNESAARAEGIEVERLRRPITAKKVGWIMCNELEFQRDGRDKRGVRYLFDDRRIRVLCERFGLDSRGTTPDQHRERHQKSGLLDSAKAENVDSVVGVVPWGCPQAGAADDSDALERAAVRDVECEVEHSA